MTSSNSKKEPYQEHLGSPMQVGGTCQTSQGAGAVSTTQQAWTVGIQPRRCTILPHRIFDHLQAAYSRQRHYSRWKGGTAPPSLVLGAQTLRSPREWVHPWRDGVPSSPGLGA